MIIDKNIDVNRHEAEPRVVLLDYFLDVSETRRYKHRQNIISDLYGITKNHHSIWSLKIAGDPMVQRCSKPHILILYHFIIFYQTCSRQMVINAVILIKLKMP
jgi:hypothetical protein